MELPPYYGENNDYDGSMGPNASHYALYVAAFATSNALTHDIFPNHSQHSHNVHEYGYDNRCIIPPETSNVADDLPELVPRSVVKLMLAAKDLILLEKAEKEHLLKLLMGEKEKEILRTKGLFTSRGILERALSFTFTSKKFDAIQVLSAAGSRVDEN